MCWACRRGLFSLTGKTGDGNIPVSIPSRPRAWGYHQQRDQFRFPPNFMPKLLCARQIRPCLCWMHIFTDPTAHRLTRAALLAPWCFGNDVYYVQVSSLAHTHSLTCARTRVPTGGPLLAPDRLVSPPFPCWRSDRRRPLSWSPISSRKGQPATRTGTRRGEQKQFTERRK